MKIGFVFIGYSQFTELEWTLHQLRHHWKQLKHSPVSVVLSGDPEQTFHGHGEDIISYVPDIVKYKTYEFIPYAKEENWLTRPGIGGEHFRPPACDWIKETGTEAILRNYQAGINNLQKIADDIDIVFITESNILLLDELSIIKIAQEKIYETDKVASVQTVQIDGQGEKADHTTGHRAYWWINGGEEILPQVMLFDWQFCKRTKFLFEYKNTRPENTEMTITDNLKIALNKDSKDFYHHVDFGPVRQGWGIFTDEHWVKFVHLDRKAGANDMSPKWQWSSRQEQLEYERQVLSERGITCFGLPCQ